MRFLSLYLYHQAYGFDVHETLERAIQDLEETFENMGAFCLGVYDLRESKIVHMCDFADQEYIMNGVKKYLSSTDIV